MVQSIQTSGTFIALMLLVLALPLQAQQTPASTELAPIPPSDVLTPDSRGQTPGLKLGLRVGVNRSSYTNDRYLDNVALDVGQVSGETDVYSTAAGFGYSIGLTVAHPYNTVLSSFLSIEFVHAAFGSSGAVDEPCVDPDSTERQGTSQHTFNAQFNYLKVVLGARFNFPDFYLSAGIAGEHPVHTSLERTRSLEDSGCRFPGTETSVLEETGEVPDPSGIHYALRLAGGLSYQLTDWLQFSPELTLDFGFNSINKSPESDLGVYGINAVLRIDI